MIAEAPGDDGDDVRLAGRFGHLVRCRVGYPLRLDRSGTRAYLPGDPTPCATLPSYDAWLADRMTRRAPVPMPAASPIGLLTTVYARTDSDLFRETADAVGAQTLAPREWLVLAHGPVPDSLDAILNALAVEGRIRLLRLPENLGIAGGLRHCLENAAAEFCLPLDADDLLTPDAIALLSAQLASCPEAKLVYSDEDHLVGGVPVQPWHRSDHDPALLLAHSWVWHAVVFHRATALGLRVYTDRSAEFAQDWDTLLRFYWAGHTPIHLQEVIYHWRQHERSLSHSGTTFSGSIESVRHLLGQIAAQAGVADRCTVEVDPFRSASPSFRLLRSEVALPPVALIGFGRRSTPFCEDFEDAIIFADQVEMTSCRGQAGLADLKAGLASVSAEFVLLLSSGVTLGSWRGLRQAVLHLEMLPEAVAVGGPLLDNGGAIVMGPLVALSDGGLLDPMTGRAAADPGPFTLAHRPHSVSLLGPDILLARTESLQSILDAAPALATLRGFGNLLGVAASRAGRRLVYEPLFSGLVMQTALLVGDPVVELEVGWHALGGAEMVGNQGMAALCWRKLHHL